MAKKDKKDPMIELNEKLDKLVSYKQVLLRGIIRGVGIAIGTTIVAAIVFAILSAVVSTVDDVPILREVIQSVDSASSTISD